VTDLTRQQPQLIDRFNRPVTYLRISITDRCDFRCVYCMAEEMTFLPRSQILSLEEIYCIAKVFVALGVTKIRVTGGEPLLRKDALLLLEKIGRLEGLKELVLTTNASQLAMMASDLRKAGVKRVNISLDSLDAVKFRQITRTGDLAQVLRGIEAARNAGFERIKINTVVLKNVNHDEVADLAAFAVANQLDISFIEEMPLGKVTGHDRAASYFSSEDVKTELSKHFELLPCLDKTGGPSVYFQIPQTQTRIGFISPHSANFCHTCNRVRLTVEGRLLLCLGNEHSVDLKDVLRNNPGDEYALRQAIIASMQIKPEKHEFALDEQPVILRHMNVTGG
jgi:cyclic pyranopterin phosphate synthase